MSKEEKEQLINIALNNIEEHLKDLLYKMRHNHYLTYTDKVLLYTEIELLMKIERWQKENV